MRSVPITVLVLFAFAVGVAGSALTASNTVPRTNAGQGAGAISSYTISGSSYFLNSNDPRTLNTASFTLDAATPAGIKTPKAKLAPSGSFQTCSLFSSTASTSTWFCNVAATISAGTNTNTLSVAGGQ